MDWIEHAVNGLFVALLASILAWILVYRRLNPKDLSSSPYYRWHQLLIALIALLAILVAVVVVLSSDPGNPDDYLFWP
jgi:cell division protein FtsX